MGWGGGGDQVSAISHEAAGLCPDPYTSTGLAQLIKVTPSPPTSTPYLRVGPLSRCVQFGAAADYLFIYLPIIWFLFSDEWLHCFVDKMSGNIAKCPSQVPKELGGIFKMLILSDQQSEPISPFKIT